MKPLTYIDRQQFNDGTRRWLWMVVYEGRLYRAGTTPDYDSARVASAVCWKQLQMSLPPGERALNQDPRDAELIDLDQLNQDKEEGENQGG